MKGSYQVEISGGNNPYSNLNMPNIPSTMFAEHNTTSFLSDGTNTEAANSAAMLKEQQMQQNVQQEMQPVITEEFDDGTSKVVEEQNMQTKSSRNN